MILLHSKFALQVLPFSLMLACASGTTPRQPETDSIRGEGRLITRNEIAALNVATVWDVLRRTAGIHAEADRHGRPADLVLRGRGSIQLEDFPILILDGARVDDLYILESISTEDVDWIRILSGPAATTFYGTNAASGVIIIKTM